MTPFEALFFTIPISFAISTALVAVTARSLRATLEEFTDHNESVAYWVPYSITMLYLVPLFAGLVFGVANVPVDGIHPALGITRIFTSVLGGCLLALTGIGWKVSIYNERARLRRMTAMPGRSRNDV